MDVKKEYLQLAKKHSLPDFEDVNKQFQISDIEKSDFLLTDVRERVADKISHYADFIADVLQPDTNLTNMYESRIFSEKEKSDIFKIFRRLMFWKREVLEVSISNDDSRTAHFITNFLKEWTDLKPKLSEIVKKVRDSWESESEQPEKLGYFG